MNKLAAVIFSTGLVASATQFSMANTTEDTAAGTAPKCSSGDKVVLVNTKTNMYTMAVSAAKGSAAGSGEAAATAVNTDKGGMARESSENKTTNPSTAATAKDYVQMCKSKADAMGAKMMPKTGDLLNSKAGTGGSH